jgi:hypothetical protein
MLRAWTVSAVEPADLADEAGQRGRRRRRPHRGVDDAPGYSEAADPGGERGLGLRDGAADRDPKAVRGDVAHLQPARTQPRGDRRGVGGGRREARAELRRREVVPVVRARRVGDPLDQRDEAGAVAQRQPDQRRDAVARRRGAEVERGVAQRRRRGRQSDAR